MATSKQLQKIYKDLGELDTKRKELIKQLLVDPTYVRNYITDFVKTEATKNVWYKRNNTEAFPKDIQIVQLQDEIKIEPSNIDNIYGVKLTFKTLQGNIFNSSFHLNAKRPLAPQIFQTLDPISNVELAKIKKQVEKLEKESLKNKAITDLEAQIVLIQAELAKLKKS
jgi:hypothetical protein